MDNVYDSQDFKISSSIGVGGFAEVHAAYWINTRTIFAIKKFVKSSTKEIDNEIRLMKIIGFHPNIIHFCGITKLKDETNYSLVLEHADGGTLREYLRDNARTFKWKNQLKFAEEIANAISHLHHKEIIHRDLHHSNILICLPDTIKLADFGRSCLQGSDCYTETEARGLVPYVDPKIFNQNQNHPYYLTKKSDIYSLGVILWELTSCKSPFNFDETKNDPSIRIRILNGERENPILNTNSKFVELYQKCWQHEPDKRPDISQAISELGNIIRSENNVSANLHFRESEVTEKFKNEDSDDNSDCYLPD